MPNQPEVGAILENVVDEMLEGFQVISPEFRYLYVNATVAAQGKSTKDKLLGRTMMECYPGIDQTPFFKELRKCLEERRNIAMENEFTFPDGSKGWFQLYIHPVTEGAMILSLDITSRKQAEAAFREKVDEIDRLMNLTVGRETKMSEMKSMMFKLKKLLPAEIEIPREY